MWLALDIVSSKSGDESREGVSFTNLDQHMFDGAGATSATAGVPRWVRDRIIHWLEDRPLIGDHGPAGQEPFMQKNVTKYTPSWGARCTYLGRGSKREVNYALCNERRTLLWFANQRAVE